MAAPLDEQLVVNQTPPLADKVILFCVIFKYTSESEDERMRVGIRFGRSRKMLWVRFSKSRQIVLQCLELTVRKARSSLCWVRSQGWKWRQKCWSLSHVWLFVQLFVTPWTVAHQVSLSVGYPRQEYWSGLPFPPPGDLPNSGIEPGSLTLQVDSLPSELPGKPSQGWFCWAELLTDTSVWWRWFWQWPLSALLS